MVHPKPKRLKDRKAIEAARKQYCEVCGRWDMAMQVHHIACKGSGGPDHSYNLITVCVACHTLAHSGRIARDTLWRIVARREGITADEAEKTVRELVRRAHVGEAD